MMFSSLGPLAAMRCGGSSMESSCSSSISTDPELDGSGLVQALRGWSLAGKPTLGFYSHVDIEARERAEQAGFSLVVPRSRMAREGAQLAEGLLAG